jgi:ribosomal-protein-alanine N-acetyltransferase
MSLNFNWTPPTLATPRLVIRPVDEADTLAVFAACSDPRLTEFTIFPTHRTLDDSLAFVGAFTRQNYSQGIAAPLAVAWNHRPEILIGCVGIHPVGETAHTVELGYWIAPAEWGRGVATEAAAATLKLAFDDERVNRVQARVIEGNLASDRVLLKLGFHLEGTLRQSLFRRSQFEDVRMYSLLRSDLT